ncbi:MAG: sensor histidine kinase [Sphingomicrobium sp.]
MSAGDRFAAIPTTAKLLLLLSAALLPIGGALIASSVSGMAGATRAMHDNSKHEADLVADALSGLVARNALALRIAANDALKNGNAGACTEAQQTLAIAPAVARTFELEDGMGNPICAVGGFGDLDRPPLTAPGDIKLWIAADGQSALLRTGVVGGSATTRLTLDEVRHTASAASREVNYVRIDDDRLSMAVVDQRGDAAPPQLSHQRMPIGNGNLVATIDTRLQSITTLGRLMILLPVLMWALAALISWWLVHRLLIRPLRRLQRAVSEFQPGRDASLQLPDSLGPATEIRQLGQAFSRAVERIDESERQMADALDGQRRLVREVHHRVKNNLQVVASLLSIHGRNAEEPEAKAAYAAIGRRVDALSVVHRNHFAELEENQGIALRPMLTELASGLRASTPEDGRPTAIELELDNASTTQDVAVAVAFLITEVVEYAMLRSSDQPVDILLKRTSELTAQLTMASPALLSEDGESPARRQFERIVDGLARQLRSPLERKLGSYSVDLPIFPAPERRTAPRAGKK